MAAYASLVSLSQSIDKLLQNHDHEKQLKCLQEHLIFLQAFVEDFPDEFTNILEARIRDTVIQAEDILERVISKEIQSALTFSQHQRALSLRVDFQALNPVLLKITEEIDSIVEEATEIKKSAGPKDIVQLNDFSVATSSSMFAPTSKDGMVGFDDDLMEIKTRLCGESSKLQVIPIVGMGGIGKTTLAKNAFYDPLIAEHFLIRAWVTVSQDYSAQEIMSNLLVSINAFNDECERRNEPTDEAVYKSLKGKRYLIVLDDMWSTNAWDDVKRIFPDDDNGSRIMLTTRLYDVAAYPDSSSHLHEMRFMNPNQSWDLLKKKVFTRDNCPLELEYVGKKIARSCRGLPLAIVLIAGLLTTVSRSQAAWGNIARNVNLVVNETNDKQLTKILSLSYNHLPHHLRPCFLYMGCFPEDYQIRASKLITLWIAEGFLKPYEDKSFEEVGEAYLEDLVNRSLVLVIKKKPNGKIKSCSVHDLVRDLCIRKADDDKFLLTSRLAPPLGFPNYIKNQHRISIVHGNLSCLANIYGSTIRTIIYFLHSIEPSFGCLGNFRLLRVLDVIRNADLRWCDFDVLPSLPVEVFELFHLRYLVFDYPLINIPPAIVNLQNLQTLIIHSSRRYESCVVFLPSEIWRMPQLRHLVSFPFYLIFPNPEIRASFALKCLQTLSEAIDFVCTEEIMRMIPNLKKLGISFVVSMDVQDYHLDNLVYLHQLEKLKLKIHPDFRGKLNPVFPTSLKKLVLSGKWGFSWEYFGEIVGTLPNLEVLKLRDHACDGETWETSEGEFLQLRFLSIENSNIKQWISESSHFPRLESIVLHHCRYLLEIPDAIGEIPTLKLIELDRKDTSLFMSAKRILKEQQENWGNDTLQVTVDNLAFDMIVDTLNTSILISNFLAYNMLRRPDGTFNRDLNEFLDRKVPSNSNPVDGVYSFDVQVDRATSLLNRVYMGAHENDPQWGIGNLEKPLSTTQIVPVIVFFHGGNFVHSSANSVIYDMFCRRLVGSCEAVVVSVNYRRSPEHRYPSAYNDGWAALKWAHSRSWLRSGHDSRVHVYLAGDSSGGNIAHHVAVRAAKEGFQVLGNILIHPLFGGQDRTDSEERLDGKYFVRIRDGDWYWRAYLPDGEDRDHPACNVFGPRSQSLEGLGFPKSLIVVAGLDLLQDWQLGYVEGLKKYGHDVELLYLENAMTGFYFLPNNDHFHCLMDQMKSFIHSCYLERGSSFRFREIQN